TFADNDFLVGNLFCIKCMKWLSQLMQAEVGDVDHVVDRFEIEGAEEILQPLRGWSYLDISQYHPGISRTICCILYLHGGRGSRLFDSQGLLFRQSDLPSQKRS